MALSQADITGTTFTSGGNTYNINKVGTVESYTAGSTTIRFNAGTGANDSQNYLTSARDVDRYIFHRQQRHWVRITSVDPVTGDGNEHLFDVGLEKPFDLSDFRAFNDLDGNAFAETAPVAGDNLGISIDEIDLFRAAQRVDIASDGTGTRTFEPEVTTNDNDGSKVDFDSIGISTPQSWRINNNVALPVDCVFKMDYGTIRGASLFHRMFQESSNDGSAWVFGRVHPNWVTGETTAQEYYTSGGVVLVQTNPDAGGSQTGTSFQFINTQMLTTSSSGEVFLRFYDGNESNEAIQRNIWIDVKMQNIGARIAGNRSFFRNVQYNAGCWRGLNFRAIGSNIFGYIENVASYDANGLLYFYIQDSGAITTVAGPQMVNPDESGGGDNYGGENEAGMVGMWQSGGDPANEQNKILNLDDMDIAALETIETNNDNNSWRFIRILDDSTSSTQQSKTGSFIRMRGTLNVECRDADGADFDDTSSKGFIWTGASSGNDQTIDMDEVTDGQFAQEKINIHQFSMGREYRFDAATSAQKIRYVDTDNPAKIAIQARGFQPVRTSLDLREYGEKTYAPTILADSEQSDTALTTIDAYNTTSPFLNTAQKLYDYSWKVLYNDLIAVNQDGSEDFFSKAGDVITLEGADLIFANTAFTLSDSNHIYDTGLYHDQDDTNPTVRVLIAADTSFDGDLVLDDDKDVTFTHAIGGSVTCRRIDFASGTISDGDTIVNTSGTITTSTTDGDEGLHLPDGTYLWDGGAVMNTGQITGSAVNPDITIVLVDGSISDDVTLQTGITLQKEVVLTIQLEEDFVNADSHIETYELDSDDNIVGSGTITAETTSADDDNNTVSLTYRIADGNKISSAIRVKQYEIAHFEGEENGTVTLDKYLTTFVDSDAMSGTLLTNFNNAIEDDNFDVTWVTYNGVDTIQFEFANDTPIAPNTAAEARDFYYKLTDQDEYLQRIARKDLEPDTMTFNQDGCIVAVEDNNQDPAVEQAKVRIQKKTGGNSAIEPKIQITSPGGADFQGGITNADNDDQKVRFNSKATNVLNTNDNLVAAANRLEAILDARDLTKTNVKNLGLFLPTEES